MAGGGRPRRGGLWRRKPGSEEDARRVAEGFLAAAAAGDARGACEYVDVESDEEASTCVDTVPRLPYTGSLHEPKIKSVTVLDGSATIGLEPTGSFTVVDADGEYKVDLESTIG